MELLALEAVRPRQSTSKPARRAIASIRTSCGAWRSRSRVRSGRPT
jgi:hypothetical protein